MLVQFAEIRSRSSTNDIAESWKWRHSTFQWWKTKWTLHRRFQQFRWVISRYLVNLVSLHHKQSNTVLATLLLAVVSAIWSIFAALPRILDFLIVLTLFSVPSLLVLPVETLSSMISLLIKPKVLLQIKNELDQKTGNVSIDLEYWSIPGKNLSPDPKWGKFEELG